MKNEKNFLLATAAVVRRELIRALAVMGITVPRRCEGTSSDSCPRPRDHHARAHHHQHDADSRRHTIFVVGSHSKLNVASTNAVVFRVGYGHEKGKDSKNQHHQAN